MPDTWISARQWHDLGPCPGCGKPMRYATRQDGKTLISRYRVIDGRRFVIPECACSGFAMMMALDPNPARQHFGRINLIPIDPPKEGAV